MPFRNRLNDFRHDQRMTGVDLIKVTGLSRNTIYGMCNDPKKLCKLETLEKMCDRLGVPIEKIVVWEDPGA